MACSFPGVSASLAMISPVGTFCEEGRAVPICPEMLSVRELEGRRTALTYLPNGRGHLGGFCLIIEGDRLIDVCDM